jgi:hypothetical protein
MIEISLTKGKISLIDDEDYDLVSQYKWQAQFGPHTHYARAALSRTLNNGRQKKIQMHRLIMNAKEGQYIDHINGNGWDNRKENLRFATNRQNQGNQRIRKFSSVYKGVCWHKRDKRWVATINIDGKTKYLGCSTSEIAAAKLYDKEAIIHFGEFAKLNFGETGLVNA